MGKRKRSMTKRLLAMLMILAMTVTLVPSSVFAAENTEPDVVYEDVETYAGTVTFKNSGYPYGENMSSSQITLVIETEETVTSYQWQVADSREGTFEDISGATGSTYTFAPASGSWYRCVADGTASEAVMAVYPGQDGRSWTKPYSSWYISNGSMAYMSCGTIFDVTGLYTKNGTDYMLCTSYGRKWDLFSSTLASPSSGTSTSASLDALRVAFDGSDDYNIFIEADLASGQQAFSFGCDTQLGNSSTSGYYSDSAALNAMVKNGVLEQVAMIGAQSVEAAADDDPAFVIAPVNPASAFWIGGFSSRKTYAYNTSGGTATEVIDGQNVVTLVESTDSGMTMSWMNIPSGGSVKFRFSVGDVAHTGAVSGKVNYETETLTGLDPNEKYDISDKDGNTHTITSSSEGEIPLAGTDDDGNPYDLTGKTITIAKQGSTDTPAEIEIIERPETPDKPSDLEEDDSTTPTVDSNIEIVELTTSSVIISPKDGQQYAYSTDGINWMMITDTDEKGNYVITGLTEGSTVSIRTRLAATSEKPASQWSEPKRVTLKSTVKASALGWNGSYDGGMHRIAVTATSPAEGVTVTYSSMADGSYSESNPAFQEVGEYTVYYRVMAEGYYPAYGSATVTIDPKEVALEWSDTKLIYNGAPQTPVASVKADSLCEGDSCSVYVDGSRTDANVKTGEASYRAEAIGLSNSNYKLPATGLTTTYTIEQRAVTLIWPENTDLIYTGEVQSFAVAEIQNKVESDSLFLAYEENEKTEVGSYSAKVTALSDANYKIADGARKNWSISYLTAEDAAISGPAKNESGWYTGMVTLTPPAGYMISGDGRNWESVLTESAEGVHTKTYYLREIETGYITDAKTVEFKIDSIAPAGEISIHTNKWTTFLNTISFRCFYKNTVDVKITGTDGGSGNCTIAYQKVSKDDHFDADGEWTQAESFSVQKGEKDKFVVYAKITDVAGNETILHSDGVVVYTDASEEDSITYTKTTKTDIATSNGFSINGNTVSSVKNGETLLLEGTDYEVSGDSIVFKGTYLDTLAVGNYVLTVSYNPLGEIYQTNVVDGQDLNEAPEDSTIALTVTREKGVVRIDDRYRGKTYDGTPVSNPDFTTNSTGSVRIEYRKSGEEDTGYTQTPPTDAGNYVVRVTVFQDENYTQASDIQNFTIGKKSILSEDVKAAILSDCYEYDGRNKTPVITVTDNTRGCTLQEGIDYELSGDTSESAQNGEDDYQITVTGKGNYRDSVEKTWSITRTLPVVETLPAASSITYGETLKDSRLTGGVAKTGSGVEVPGTFTWADDTIKPLAADSGATAYEVIFTPEDTDNFDSFTCEVTLVVRPKTVKLLWSDKSFTYNGKARKPRAEVTNLEKEDTDQVTVVVSGEQIDANTYRDYTATAASLEGSAAANYRLSDNEEDNQTTFKIYPKKITAAMVTAVAIYPYTGNTVIPTISVEDSISGLNEQSKKKILVKDFDYVLSGEVSESEMGSYTANVSGVGNYTGIVAVDYRITDSSAPTGTIKVSGNTWNTLLGGISFELFYQAGQRVTITAEDEGSGVDEVFYYLTSNETAMSKEALSSLPEMKWTRISNGGSFSIEPDQKYVIYAKITDKSGNVTFLSSNGMVLDKNAPTITGIERYRTYCSDVTFAVTDAIGLASVKIDDVEKNIGGSYTIPASAQKENHKIVAEDMAGNRTTYMITINANGEHSVSDWEVVTPATCEEKGIRSRTCLACGFTQTEEIPALGHDFQAGHNEDAHFVWTAEKDSEGIVEGYTATAYFICRNDGRHTDRAENCTVDRQVTVPATEETEGVVTYTATASYNGLQYSAEKTTTLAKLTKLEDPFATENSNIYTSTSVAEKAPALTVDEGLDIDLAKDLMTPAEEASYRDAKVAMDVIIYLEVQNITGAVIPEETRQIEAQIADIVTEKTNTAADVEVETGAAYLDLSMYKNVATNEIVDGEVMKTDTTTQISDTGKDITITVEVPEDVPEAADGFTRTYTVIRLHEGNAQALDTQQNGNLLTFRTNKFSTYAITYVDVKEISQPSRDVPVDSIQIISDESRIMEKGESIQLTIVFEPADAAGRKVTWSSSNPKVASVDENGKVTAVGDGTATITATTPNGKTASITITVKKAPAGSGAADIKMDTSYRKLRLCVPASTKTGNKLFWARVSDADGYVIYGNPCNTAKQRYKMVKKTVIRDGDVTTWTDRNLKQGTYYKYCVKAYKLVNGKRIWIARSKVVHAATSGGRYGNVKAVKVNRTNISLRTGRTLQLKAKQIAVSAKTPIQYHTGIQYESSNTRVAKVDRNGKITALGKGTCYIYVYAQNGIYKKVKVTVK